MDKRKGVMLSLLTSLFWGVMGVFSRNLLDAGFSALDVSFLRCLVAGIGLMAFSAVFKRDILKISVRGLLIALVYGALAYSLSFYTYSLSVERIPIGVATVLMFMSPIWVSVLGAIFFKERLGRFKWSMIAVCIFGGVLVSNVIGSAVGKLDALGVTAGIINGFGVALQLMIPRYFADRYARESLLCYGLLGAALVLCPFVDFSFAAGAFSGGEGGWILLNILVVGGVCTLLGNGFYVKASEYIGTAATSMLVATEIIIAAVMGYLIYGETINALQLTGFVLIIGAVMLFRRKD